MVFQVDPRYIPGTAGHEETEPGTARQQNEENKRKLYQTQYLKYHQSALLFPCFHVYMQLHSD